MYNISPSLPANSFKTFIKSIEPDILLISVTLEENIKPMERLIAGFQIIYPKKIPVMIGGAAFRKRTKDNTKNKKPYYLYQIMK